jgi:hypothetical protein
MDWQLCMIHWLLGWFWAMGEEFSNFLDFNLFIYFFELRMSCRLETLLSRDTNFTWVFLNFPSTVTMAGYPLFIAGVYCILLDLPVSKGKLNPFSLISYPFYHNRKNVFWQYVFRKEVYVFHDTKITPITLMYYF